MNKITAKTDVIRKLLEAAPDAETTVEKAGIYSSIRILAEDLCREDVDNSYAREKAYNLSTHTAAMFNFDQDYGMQPSAHYKAAFVELESLESSLTYNRY
ncbi:hypothetical protein [Pseudomonas piscis]|uniref:hypothetical protein n=1 Tax=Pseudomonas piscis TaxID=2614538 RepID=UPI0021D573E0|nr:hypothetical protein [Pseudomonas piscis]MCU7645665.1 hypothetical protein [Pseudomonas piscis]